MCALSRKTETIGPRYTYSDCPRWENDDIHGDTYNAYRDVKEKRKPPPSAEKRVPVVSKLPKQCQASIKVTLVKPLDRRKCSFSFIFLFPLKGWNFVLRPLNDPKGRKTLCRIAAIAGWRESCFSTDILQYLITSWRFCWMKGRTYLQRWKMHPLKEGYRKNSEHGLKNAIESLIRRWDYERISGKHVVAPHVGGGYFL